MQTGFPKYKNCRFRKIKESTERNLGMSTRVAILAILLLDMDRTKTKILLYLDLL